MVDVKIELFTACEKGNIIAINELLETHKIHIDIQNGDNCTLLMIACLYGHIELIRFLIKKGANLEAKDRVGHTAIMYIFAHNDINIIKLFIEKGSDLEVVDSFNKTFFDYLSKKASVEVENLLQEIKANVKPAKRR
jgi:ankyrin repeat protein